MAFPLILFFLKAPIAGQVKTRIAQDLGDEEALGVYLKLVRHQVNNLPEGWPVEVYYTGTSDVCMLKDWLGLDAEYFVQDGNDLGERLAHAFQSSFDRGAAAAVAIGGDCPWLNRDIFEKLLKALQDNEVVVGPSSDGGYYLIGMCNCHSQLFDKVEWSTSRVMDQTVERMKASGIGYVLLPELEDVDDLSAWERAQEVM